MSDQIISDDVEVKFFLRHPAYRMALALARKNGVSIQDWLEGLVLKQCPDPLGEYKGPALFAKETPSDVLEGRVFLIEELLDMILCDIQHRMHHNNEIHEDEDEDETVIMKIGERWATAKEKLESGIKIGEFDHCFWDLMERHYDFQDKREKDDSSKGEE